VPADVERAAALLRAGRLVAFATETVYGLGADALAAEAVAGIFAAKKRPGWDPLIVHVAGAEELGRVAVVDEGLRERVERLAAAFWPGPLTLLLPRTAAVPDAVTAGRPLVGVRVPAHPAAQALLRAAGVPVAAPSANLFGHTSPTTAEHVLADLDGRIDAVLDAGPTPVGVESTVVDPTQTPMMLYRPGAVSAEAMEAACGVAVTVYVPPVERGEPEALPSPGVGIRHYAPRARMVLVGGTEGAVRKALRGVDGERVGVLLPEGWHVSGPGGQGASESAGRRAQAAGGEPGGGAVVEWGWGAWDRPEELAARLYAGMRALDEAGVEVIVCPLPESGGVRDAIRDRLGKAARA
jgi:L-threonylcarbamoyladenylate synthase